MVVRSIFREGLMRGKVAIVTGGGTGIGNCIARELANLGCKVVIASRNAERLGKAAVALQKEFSPDTVAAIPCNIRNEAEVSKLFEETLAKYGRVDCLVNNGGGQFPSRTADISLKGWNAVVDTNLTGTFLMCKQAYHSWMAEHGGAIVNITVCMRNGFSGMSHTGAARAGVENLSKSLSVEWAESGVRINNVAPGVIYVRSAVEAYGDKGEGEALFKASLPRIPARRLGTPEEVSAAVTYLLSPAAAYVTGETVHVDGGWSLYNTHHVTVPDHDRCPEFSWAEGSKSKM